MTTRRNWPGEAVRTLRARMTELRVEPLLFASLLGADYEALPSPVRRLHDMALPLILEGEVDIEVARNPILRVLGRVIGLPARAGSFPLTFEITGSQSRQLWIRHFPPRPMRSAVGARNGLLHERMAGGLVTLDFRLRGNAEGIVWNLLAVRMLGLPLPLAWFRGISARESAAGARYRFDVSAALPIIGHLVSYRGSLDV